MANQNPALYYGMSPFGDIDYKLQAIADQQARQAAAKKATEVPEEAEETEEAVKRLIK